MTWLATAGNSLVPAHVGATLAAALLPLQPFKSVDRKDRPGNNRSRYTGLFCLLLILVSIPAQGASSTPFSFTPPSPIETVSFSSTVLQENALFFSILVGFSLTASVCEDLFGYEVDNINLNLLTRERRDSLGKQLVSIRIGGKVRSNRNVELDLLDAKGTPVGRFFFGNRSGDLIAFDLYDREILRGKLYSDGTFYLDDLRLEEGHRRLASGKFRWIQDYPLFEYEWIDREEQVLASGLMYFWGEGSWNQSVNRIRTYWYNDEGMLSEELSTGLEAEYDLRAEVTGAINSNIFDRRTDAASFFEDPNSLIPGPPTMQYLPAVEEESLLTLWNHATQDHIRLTMTAYAFDGSLLQGPGIRNPISYEVPAQSAWTAPLRSWLRAALSAPADTLSPVMQENGLPVWLEIQADHPDLHVSLSHRREKDLEWLPAFSSDSGKKIQCLSLPAIGQDDTIEILLLNPSSQATYANLTLSGKDGATVGSADRFYIPKQGFRLFPLVGFPELFADIDPTKATILEVEATEEESPLIAMAICRRSTGEYFYTLGFDATQTSDTPVAPFLVFGWDGRNLWDSHLSVPELSGKATTFSLGVYSLDGKLRKSDEQTVPAWGSLELDIRRWAQAGDSGDMFAGFLRLQSPDDVLFGNMTLSTQVEGTGGATGMALPSTPHRRYQLLLPSLLSGDGEDNYLGLTFFDPQERESVVQIEVHTADGKTYTRNLRLPGNAAQVRLLSELFPEEDISFTPALVRVTAGEPIYFQAMWGQGRAGLAWLPVVASE